MTFQRGSWVQRFIGRKYCGNICAVEKIETYVEFYGVFTKLYFIFVKRKKILVTLVLLFD